jgi:hypothetical protein
VEARIGERATFTLDEHLSALAITERRFIERPFSTAEVRDRFICVETVPVDECLRVELVPSDTWRSHGLRLGLRRSRHDFVVRVHAASRMRDMRCGASAVESPLQAKVP